MDRWRAGRTDGLAVRPWPKPSQRPGTSSHPKRNCRHEVFEIIEIDGKEVRRCHVCGKPL